MRRSSEPEKRTQFTVAELLARYGDAPPPTGRRRRRAAPEPDALEDTVAHPVLPSTWLDGAEDCEPKRPARDSGEFSKGKLSSLPNWAPAVGPPAVPRKTAPATPPVVAKPASLAGPAASDGPPTDQLPRYDPAPEPASWSSRRPAGTQLLDPQPLSAPLLRSQPPAGLGAATRADPEQDAALTDDVDIADEPSRSPLWEWLAMVSQVGLGILGGATLWLICEWLWQHIPVVALVVALAVITGLVWVVRRVRRAEDLQTTVIAVLVGLFVTVSPAALLLVGR